VYRDDASVRARLQSRPHTVYRDDASVRAGLQSRPSEIADVR
jgi:hypothetical protein